MTGPASGIQGPVVDPHLRVARIGVSQAAGGTVATRPATSRVMGIVEVIPRAAIKGDMTPSRRASVHIAPPKSMLAGRVTVHAIAAACRNARLQVRNCRMAEVAITAVGNIDRCISGTTRVVTACTCCPVVVLCTANRHVRSSHMVDTAVSSRFIRMTVQTVGRVGAQGDGIDHLLPRTIMTGFTGTGPVGGYIMFSAINLGPVRHDMTVTAGCAVRQVTGTQRNSMAMVVMD